MIGEREGLQLERCNRPPPPLPPPPPPPPPVSKTARKKGGGGGKAPLNVEVKKTQERKDRGGPFASSSLQLCLLRGKRGRRSGSKSFTSPRFSLACQGGRERERGDGVSKVTWWWKKD